MYSVAPYYIAKVIADVPVMVIIPLLYQLIVYFGIGLTITATKFFYYYLITFLQVIAAMAIGYFLSSIFAKPETAVMITPTIMMPIILFGGLFTNVETYPVWITWV